MDPSRLDAATVDLRATIRAIARSAGELRVQAQRCERQAEQLQRAGELVRRTLRELEALRAELQPSPEHPER